MESNILTGAKAATMAVVMLTAFWGWFGWLIVAWVCLMLTD